MVKKLSPTSRSQCLQGEFFPLYFPLASFAYVNMSNSVVQIRELNQGQGDEVAPSFFITSIFYKNQHNLRNKAFFSLRSEIRSKKRLFSLRSFLLLNEAFSFYSFKISRLWGKRKLNLRSKKSLYKIVKNISVLNVDFSKSVLVHIKNGCNLAP